jgi:hypothetical protein
MLLLIRRPDPIVAFDPIVALGRCRFCWLWRTLSVLGVLGLLSLFLVLGLGVRGRLGGVIKCGFGEGGQGLTH